MPGATSTITVGETLTVTVLAPSGSVLASLVIALPVLPGGLMTVFPSTPVTPPVPAIPAVPTAPHVAKP